MRAVIRLCLKSVMTVITKIIALDYSLHPYNFNWTYLSKIRHLKIKAKNCNLIQLLVVLWLNRIGPNYVSQI